MSWDAMRYEVIEFRGGPRDGERMVFQQGMAPPEILVPIRRPCSIMDMTTPVAQLPPPHTQDVFPVGTYVPETGPYEYDTLAVSHEVIMHSKCQPADLVLASFQYKRLRPMMWKWLGER